MSELQRVIGIAEDIADQLETMGLGTLEYLAFANDDMLAEAFDRPLDEVQRWIEMAGELMAADDADVFAREQGEKEVTEDTAVYEHLLTGKVRIR